MYKERAMFGKPFKWHLRVALITMAFGLIPVFVIGYTPIGSNSSYLHSFCESRNCQCSDWRILTRSEYMVENNVWNKGDISNYQQCTYVERNGQGINAYWAWNWLGLRFNVVAYPSIVYGKKPWFDSSTSDLLPKKISELACLTVDFAVDQQGRGNGNLAFDLWATRDQAASPESITREIMIWLSHAGILTAGKRVDSLSLDGYEIELWRKEGHRPTEGLDWTLLTFVYQSDRIEGPINVMDYLDFLVENGYISADEYLADVELGNEIVSGYGQTIVQGFEVSQCD
jgi:hypothetical protein